LALGLQLSSNLVLRWSFGQLKTVSERAAAGCNGEQQMNSAIERLLTLRVSDVMTKKVISISSQDSMADAARKLRDHSISGLPVVDSQERCTGILSALDFVKQAKDSDRVSQHMTSSVQSIGASQPLLKAARVMCTNHIHRLPVLDDQQRPIGMVTALDVVAALIHAIEE